MVASYYDTSYPPSLWNPPAPPPAPTLVSITPTTAVINAAITIQANGTGYVNGDQIRAGVASLTTTFISPTALTAAYTAPATAQTVQVSVSGVNGTSGTRPLTITATGLEEEAEQSPPEEEAGA